MHERVEPTDEEEDPFILTGHPNVKKYVDDKLSEIPEQFRPQIYEMAKEVYAAGFMFGAGKGVESIGKAITILKHCRSF